MVDYRGQAVSALNRLRLQSGLPVMAIWGEKDNIIPVDPAYAAQAAREGSRLEVLPGVGHFAQVEAPTRGGRPHRGLHRHHRHRGDSQPAAKIEDPAPPVLVTVAPAESESAPVGSPQGRTASHRDRNSWKYAPPSTISPARDNCCFGGIPATGVLVETLLDRGADGDLKEAQAAIVPDCNVKPTSTYTLVRIDDRLDVVAHLSEAVPRFWLVDNVALEQVSDPRARTRSRVGGAGDDRPRRGRHVGHPEPKLLGVGAADDPQVADQARNHRVHPGLNSSEPHRL